jgi:hypothetical protein
MPLCRTALLILQIAQKEIVDRDGMGLPVGQGLDRRGVNYQLVLLAGIRHAHRQADPQADIGDIGEFAVAEVCIVPQMQIQC